MNRIINNTNFVGRFSVANNTTVTVAAILNDMVDTNQELYLRELLGPVYYAQFSAWYDLPIIDRPINVTWSGLINGIQFTDIGSNQRYLQPISKALLGYCYDRWNRQNLTQTVAMGEANTDMQNAGIGVTMYKTIDRWNEAVDVTRTAWLWLDKNLQGESDWVQWKSQISNWWNTSWLYFWYDFPDIEIMHYQNRLDL